MAARVLVSTLAALVVAATSGCHCLHKCFPHIGWRLHQCCPSACAPVCAAPCSPCGPVAFRPAVVASVGPDCPTCVSGPAMPPPTAFSPGSAPPGAYPPIIGNPMPLPNPPAGTGSQLHNPAQVPTKPTGN
jgi:hypothetical protein